jgi:hypothetical protein
MSNKHGLSVMLQRMLDIQHNDKNKKQQTMLNKTLHRKLMIEQHSKSQSTNEDIIDI